MLRYIAFVFLSLRPVHEYSDLKTHHDLFPRLVVT